MAKYAADLHRTASAAASLGSWGADATRPRRGKLYDILVGSEASPADNAFLYVLQRCTALGTSTSVTPFALDPGDAATESDVGENHTVEPTYTSAAILLSLPLNQRATFRWVAPPEGQLVYPATAANGIGIQTPTSSAVAITATVYLDES